MAYYICSECHNVDCLELVYKEFLYKPFTTKDKKDLLCSECKEGEWHGVFDKKKYQPSDKFDVINLFEVENPTINVSLG